MKGEVVANPEHVEVVKKGAKAIQKWRKLNPNVRLDLEEADLGYNNLIGADLRNCCLAGADLTRTDLEDTDLSGVDLTKANLECVDLSGANVRSAKLVQANLIEAYLIDTDFMNADMSGANLSQSILRNTIFSYTKVDQTKFNHAEFASAAFSSMDLSSTIGLESVTFHGPCDIGLDTIIQSRGQIPPSFLEGCGIPRDMIDSALAIGHGIEPIQFYSCFISYSHKDEEFAKRLHDQLRAANLRVWYAPEDMKGGEELHKQIEKALRVHDKLLLILSEESMNSKWVEVELSRTLKQERKEKRRKLFPIRLCSFEAIEKWECFSTDLVEDMAETVRKYFIPDFTGWKNHDAFEEQFAKLLDDMKKEGPDS